MVLGKLPPEYSPLGNSPPPPQKIPPHGKLPLGKFLPRKMYICDIFMETVENASHSTYSQPFPIDIYSTKKWISIPFSCSQGGFRYRFLPEYIVCNITASL